MGKCSVLIYVYGGKFANGNATQFMNGPNFLLNDNIVFVTLNYRVDMFGFLSTYDEAALGNVGIKDQKVAVEWVRDHISNFGGDPSKITLMGHSAGAVSAHLLSMKLSPGEIHFSFFFTHIFYVTNKVVIFFRKNFNFRHTSKAYYR